VTLRLAFVPGCTPDKWARTWREREREPLELTLVEEADQRRVLDNDEADLVLARLPLDREGVHCIPLYDELPVVVLAADHVLTLLEEVPTSELGEEQLVLGPVEGIASSVPQLPFPPMSAQDAVATAAAGTGVAVLPMAVARLHHRKDATYRVVPDLPPTRIGLAWRIDRDDDARIQTFIGIVRGRTARSSR
jgi:DNA-binding transcriptional LysR family regulator